MGRTWELHPEELSLNWILNGGVMQPTVFGNVSTTSFNLHLFYFITFYIV